MLFLVFGVCLAFTGMSQTTRIWNNKNGGAWGTASNWIGGVPVANDFVVIDSNIAAPITGVPAISLRKLRVNGNCQLEPGASNVTLTITDSFFLASGATFRVGITSGKMSFSLGAASKALVLGTYVQNAGNPTGTFTAAGDLAFGANGLINGTGAFTLSSGATLRMAGANGIAAGSVLSGHVQVTGARSYNAGANYVYNGTVDQSTGDGFPTSLTGSITIDNVNRVTLPAARTVTTGTVNLWKGTFFTANFLTMGNSATTATATINRIEGTILGAVQGTNGYSVVYTGNSKSTDFEFSGAGVRSLTVNLSVGQTLFLSTPKSLAGTLTLSSGILNTQGNMLNLTNTASTAVGLGSASSYVIGSLQRSIATGAGTYHFPIGTQVAYAPLTMNFTSVGSAGSVTVSTNEGDNIGLSTSSINELRSVNRKWSVNVNSGISTASYNATFGWMSSDQDAGFDYSNATVGLWNGTGWSYPAVASRNTNSIAVNGISGFGDFQVGKACVFTAISAQPANTRICKTGYGELSVSAIGDGELSYQWTRNGELIPDANATSLVVSDTALYNVKVSGECRSAVSSDAVVSFKPDTKIDLQPIGGAKCAGDQISVTASGEGNLSYQWKLNGNDINGALGNSLAVNEPGYYSVNAIGECGSDISTAVEVFLNTPTRILGQPIGITVDYGQNAQFSIAAEGTGSLSYQWQESAGDLWSDYIVEGGAAAQPQTELVISKPAVANSGKKYKCVVTGLCGPSVTEEAVLTVNKVPLTIIAEDKTKVYGEENPTLTYRVEGFVEGENLDNAGLMGTPALTTVVDTVTGVGEDQISIDAGSLAAANYSFNFVNGKITVQKATLTITANSKTKTYGDVNPVFDASYKGFVRGDKLGASDVAGEPVITCAAGDSAAAGTYTISLDMGTLASANYNFQLENGTFTINKANLFVLVKDTVRLYGDANPSFEAEYAGFVMGETPEISGLTGAPGFTTEAVDQSPVGIYEILADNGTLSVANYDLTFVKGSLKVDPAPLTVKAVDVNKFYGLPNPELTVAYEGFKNNETRLNSDVTGDPQLFTTVQEFSPVGVYPISIMIDNMRSGNYTLSKANGNFNVSVNTCLGNGALKVSDSCFTKPYQLVFTPSTGTGPFTLIINDSVYRNIQAGVPFTPGAVSENKPESIFSASVIGGEPTVVDNDAVELGVRFQPNVNGQITGIRFYKRSADVGTHTGSLWSTNGTLLARATFQNESESGWQQVNFSTPVTVTAGTTYIASYFAPNGNYSYAADVFTSKRITNLTGSLTALSATEGGNGVYLYGGGFPTNVSNANYYVDVVFNNTSKSAKFMLSTIVSASGCSNGGKYLQQPTVLARPFIGLSIAKQDNECWDVASGTINLTANACNGPVLFSIDSGATFQSSGSFANLASGTYKVRVKDALDYVRDTTVSISVDKAVWTGAVNSDWHTAGNWNTGRVPTAKTHVIIPSTPNRCQINADAVAASVQVAPSTNIRINSNRRLTMTGKCKVLPPQ
jgi:hypothetical protein